MRAKPSATKGPKDRSHSHREEKKTRTLLFMRELYRMGLSLHSPVKLAAMKLPGGVKNM